MPLKYGQCLCCYIHVIIKRFYTQFYCLTAWDDIGYNFLIGEDGRVYEGRGWNKVGAHTFGWNKVSVSFAFMGNFHEKEADPLAIDALKEILSYGVSQGLLSTDYKIYGHRDARPTIGPGNKLYSQIQSFDHFDHNKPVKPTN